ncbi:hypothetical protein [Microvirga yunnanensis]|uniref:hypothetical protein n=1 Tax=Microvirga yunnanensis TaxID=2953740 RepID=UPI0021C8AB4B|nr:hypothetical protein [Microvirga sp. HBU65207]
MPAIPYPVSSTPGQRPGEGQGRLINVYAETLGESIRYLGTPGLAVFANAGKSTPRGMIEVNGDVYAVYAAGVVKVAANGAVTALAGSIPGTDGVTLARNNRVSGGVSTPDIVAVRETGGAYVLTPTTVSAYPDADLPATANSVAFLDAFLIFSVADGRIFASELNATAINALSVATAEAQPDGLIRCVSHAGVIYAMGRDTIEPWLNVGDSPFPLQRGTSVLSVGLLTAMAIAGFGVGWDDVPYFVAHNKTVQALKGYQTEKVSTPDVEAFIAASTVSTLEACVYTLNGNAFWSLSSDQGTWELNVRTGQWHERVSAGLNCWRGSKSVKANDKWLIGDRLSTNLLTVSESLRTEAGTAVEATFESGPLKESPTRMVVPSLFGEFTPAEETDVAVSWSHDGGKTWSNPVTRSLEQADKFPVRVNRLGLSTHHGFRVRFKTSSAKDFAFMGASVPDPQGRTP